MIGLVHTGPFLSWFGFVLFCFFFLIFFNIFFLFVFGHVLFSVEDESAIEVYLELQVMAKRINGYALEMFLNNDLVLFH